jgi:hypothetical protein
MRVICRKNVTSPITTYLLTRSSMATLKTCSILGCGKKHRGRGWCSMHLSRFVRHGDANAITRRSPGTGSFNKGSIRITKNGKSKGAHVLVVEKVLGHELPQGSVVHHINRNPSDNRPENLVVCQDQAYHLLLHQRQRALEKCGNAEWRPCGLCGKHEAPENLSSLKPGSIHHAACHARYERERRLKKHG